MSVLQIRVSMKYLKILVNLESTIPRFCRGSAVGQIATSAAGSAISTGMNFATSNYEQNRNFHFQHDEAQLNRDWNTAEAEKARAYQTQEREESQRFQSFERQAQQAYETNQWHDRFDTEAAYNSPVEQAKRLRAVGVNPQIALGNQGTAQISGSSVNAPTGRTVGFSGSPQASGIAGVSPVPRGPGISLAQDLAALANVKKSLSESDYTDSQNQYLQRSMSDALEMIHQSALGEGLKNEGAKIMNDLSKIDLKYKEKQKVSEILNIINDSMLKIAQGKAFTNQAELYKAQEDLTKMLEQKTGYESKLVALEVSTYFRRLNSTLALQSTQANLNTATAKKTEAETQTIEGMRDDLLKLKKFEGSMAEMDALFKESTYYPRLQKELQQLKTEGKISEKEYEKANLDLQRLQSALRMRDRSEVSKRIDNMLYYFSRDLDANPTGAIPPVILKP